MLIRHSQVSNDLWFRLLAKLALIILQLKYSEGILHNLIYIFSHFISRTIDLLDWNSLIDDTTKISNLLMVPNLKVSRCNVNI